MGRISLYYLFYLLIKFSSSILFMGKFMIQRFVPEKIRKNKYYQGISLVLLLLILYQFFMYIYIIMNHTYGLYYQKHKIQHQVHARIKLVMIM
jgi:hypothetical protein